MKKLKTILLIDDSESTNLYNHKVLTSMKLCEHVEVKLNGQDALDYITQVGKYQNESSSFPRPDMILVDIEMPVMNGFDFVSKYHALDQKYKTPDGVIISMLTENYSSESYAKSKDKLGVHDFIVKPLDAEGVEDLWDKFVY